MDLSLQLKEMLIRECNVKNCAPEDISDADQLIGGTGKLKLDSLDAVEIVSALERFYAIHLEDPGQARKIMKTFGTLRDFVQTNRQ